MGGCKKGVWVQQRVTPPMCVTTYLYRRDARAFRLFWPLLCIWGLVVNICSVLINLDKGCRKMYPRFALCITHCKSL